MHVSARRDHASTVVDGRHNLGIDSLRAAGEGNDWLASLTETGAANEVHLTADAGDELGAHRVRDDLSREIHLDGRVDRGDLRVLADHCSVVDVRDVQVKHVGVVVHEVHEVPRPDGKGGDDLAGVVLLELVRDNSVLHEAQEAVAEHLRVHAEVLMVLQGKQCRIRNDADPRLDRGAILHKRRDVGANLVVNVQDLGGRVMVDRVVHFHGRFDEAHVDEGVAVGPRHVRVDLRDDGTGLLAGRHCHVHAGAQAAVAVLLVRAPGRHRFANVGAHEEGVGSEADFRLGGDERILALGVDTDDLHVRQRGMRPARQRFDQMGRGHGGAVNEDRVAALDHLDGLIGRHVLQFFGAVGGERIVPFAHVMQTTPQSATKGQHPDR
mmetsp:Transcript_9493/g.35541  ORF Transcript_9493/g.35541 Transcript_9493/m.35541 type:complete len:381 (+) Transcript_9493:438-1580(+)